MGKVSDRNTAIQQARDIGELEWVLGIGMTRFVRSTFGDMLERARVFGYDSAGKRVPSISEDKYRIVISEDEDGLKRYMYTTGWNVVPIREQRHEPSYTPDDHDLERFARVTRRLERVAREDTTAFRVLCAYHGDAGARWGREKVGRTASIYSMTPVGAKLLNQARARFATSVDLRDDEVLATEIDLQTRQPNDLRRKQLERMRLQADELLVHAHTMWNRSKAA